MHRIRKALVHEPGKDSDQNARDRGQAHRREHVPWRLLSAYSRITAEEHVIREADLLGLRSYFGPHIYGSTPDLALSSKDAILTGLLRDEKVSGEQVLCFGDGPVELALCRAAGGLAIGVASDEMENGSGRNDPHKRQVLVGAGAHAIIPDYREPQALIECLLGE